MKNSKKKNLKNTFSYNDAIFIKILVKNFNRVELYRTFNQFKHVYIHIQYNSLCIDILVSALSSIRDVIN